MKNVIRRLLRAILAGLLREKRRLDWKIAKAEHRVTYSETSMAVYKLNHSRFTNSK